MIEDREIQDALQAIGKYAATLSIEEYATLCEELADHFTVSAEAANADLRRNAE